MKYEDPVLAEIEAFRAKRPMSDRVFGIKAVGDPSLILDLKNGRELRSATRQAVRDYIADPDGKRKRKKK
jgi:hypothetical protein